MVRQATNADYIFIYGLYFHPKVNPFLLYEMEEAVHFPTIFKELMAKHVLYIFENKDERIGMFKLAPWSYRTSHIAYLGGVAIDPQWSGKGHGQQMMEEILALGKEQGYKRIELSTATINTKAIHLYKKLGFQEEGILRQYCYMKSEDRYLDEVMMSYLYL